MERTSHHDDLFSCPVCLCLLQILSQHISSLRFLLRIYAAGAVFWSLSLHPPQQRSARFLDDRLSLQRSQPALWDISISVGQPSQPSRYGGGSVRIFSKINRRQHAVPVAARGKKAPESRRQRIRHIAAAFYLRLRQFRQAVRIPDPLPDRQRLRKFFMPPVPAEGCPSPISDSRLPIHAFHQANRDIGIDSAGRQRNGMAVRQCGSFMDNVHRLPGLRKIRAESGIKVIRCGKYSHQRTISVGGHLIPTAQNRLHPFFIPEQRLRRCNSAVEPFPPRRVFPILIPVQETLHDIMGMDAPCFPDTLSQAQGQAAIVRPCPFRLSICPSARHLRDRLPL